MSEKSVVAFDPEALKNAIRDRVQAAFVDVIPAEAWDTMVEGEVKSFFEEEQKIVLSEEKRRHGDTWATDEYEVSRRSMTPFRQLVYEQLRPLVVAEITERLNSEKFKVDRYWSGDELDGRLSDYFEGMLKGMVPELVSAMFKGVFTRAADAARKGLLQ